MPRRNYYFSMVFGLLMDRIFSQSTAAIVWPLLRRHSFFCFLTKISWKSSPSRPFAVISTLPMKPSLIAEMSGLTSSQFEKSASLTFGFKKKPNQLNPHKLWSFYPNSYLRFTSHDISNAVYYPFLSQGLQAKQYLNCCPWLWEQTLYPELFFNSSFLVPGSSVALSLYILRKLLRAGLYLFCSAVSRHNKSHDPWLLLA